MINKNKNVLYKNNTTTTVLSSGLSKLQQLIFITLIGCYKPVHGLCTVGINECWWPMKPLNKEYSYNSPFCKRYSRIDYFLVSFLESGHPSSKWTTPHKYHLQYFWKRQKTVLRGISLHSQHTGEKQNINWNISAPKVLTPPMTKSKMKYKKVSLNLKVS